MLDLLIYILVLCVVFGVLLWALSQLPLPAPIGQVARVVLVVIFVVILLYQLVPVLHVGAWRH